MVGSFAVSRAGHDKTALYVVVANEGDFVFLCDGRYKTVEKPKKKRVKHIQIINRTIDAQLLTELCEGKITNEQIKYAIRQYYKP